ncbi:MAG: hypothetical protein A2289_07580 [Deltaproteobacteria bacterium RIFOXYA12_FULL_58_15]|nr:MAG: hypothetical protein A2289_07580 [Deltaproteobacteria bacterium RIFOXYA12_FULL_58_15]OGR10092.1 MAG: hypothetical protein A2341_21360 [Deltaproteobacteria bacterium RIFOXYB12_FULL_58_9]
MTGAKTKQETDPGRSALIYDPSTVSWAVAEGVARPPAFAARLTLYLITSTVLITCAISLFATVAINVSGRGMIRSVEKSRQLRAPVTGKIAKLNVVNGERVGQDQILIEMDELVRESERQGVEKYLKKINELLRLKDERNALSMATTLIASTPRLSNASLTRELATMVEALRNYVQALRNQHEVVPELLRGDIFERTQVQKKIRRIRALKSASILANDLAELETTLARLNVSINDRIQQAKNQVATARTTLQVDVRTFEEALRFHVESQQIKSPTEGVIGNIALGGAGDLVTAGEILLQVIPVGGPLVAEVEIANKDIADIRVGLPVRIKLDALPYQDYGFLKGRVREVPQDVKALEKEKEGDAVYLVLASLDVDQMTAPSGEKKPILLGMALSADITTKKRALWQLALVETLKLRGLF